MIKKSITFPNLNGEQITRDFYFNVNLDEAIEKEMTDGVSDKFKQLTETESGEDAYWIMKDLVVMAYGERDEDGITFNKTPEITRKFTQTGAFSALLVEFVKDTKAAADFFNGLFPEGMMDEVLKAVEASKEQTPEKTQHPLAMKPDARQRKPVEDVSLPEKTFEDFTDGELLQMPDEEFQKLVPHAAKDMSKKQLQIAMQRANQAS